MKSSLFKKLILNYWVKLIQLFWLKCEKGPAGPEASGEGGCMPPGEATRIPPRWGLGGPASTAPCTWTLLPSSDVSTSSGNPVCCQAEAMEIGQKAPAWENEKRGKKSPRVESGEQWCPTAQLISLSHSHLCSEWLNVSRWASSLSPPTLCLPHSLKPVVFSALRWHTHHFHLSNYVNFQADVLWQSYTAFTSLFKKLIKFSLRGILVHLGF